MKPIIKVENLGKEYRLGIVGTGTIKDDLKRWWYQLRGKEDPFLQVGETNDRAHKGNSDYVWALRDINFEVMPGEVLGIIGRNGAGKSTLLKILSRVTEPTKGRVTMNGRVASLLEVGTGFHPDLTGRENIYLNGAILGMTRKEIDRKFDEIVDFAGVERYIDTPVKRYSSGMHVRLGFSVAAHLEPDILVVDEVLSVGDAEFQKKCLGKMKEVSETLGRTVLFVSHNLQAVQKLCDCAISLHNGAILTRKTDTFSAIQSYLDIAASNSSYEAEDDNFRDLKILSGYCGPSENESSNELILGSAWVIVFDFVIKRKLDNVIPGVGISAYDNIPIHTSWMLPQKLNPGKYRAKFIQNRFNLAAGKYNVSLGISQDKNNLDFVENAFSFEIVDNGQVIDQRLFVNQQTVGFLLDQMDAVLSKI